jgi:hypothetical protein
MSFCTRCGTQLTPGAAFCTNCGAPVAAAPVSSTPASAAPYAPAPYAPPGPPAAPGSGKRTRTIAIVAATAVVLAGGGAATWLLLDKQSLAECIIGSWRADSLVNTEVRPEQGGATINYSGVIRLVFRENGTYDAVWQDVTMHHSNSGDTPLEDFTDTARYVVTGDVVDYSDPDAVDDYSTDDTATCSGDELTLTGESIDDGYGYRWVWHLRRE